MKQRGATEVGSPPAAQVWWRVRELSRAESRLVLAQTAWEAARRALPSVHFSQVECEVCEDDEGDETP